jgi:nicotinamidase-related amidase
VEDALLIVDVFGDFAHDDGDRLLASYRARFDALEELLASARRREVPVVFANDSSGVYDGDARGIVDRARAGPAGDLVQRLTPRPGDRFILKPRYSAFDSTPLGLVLAELGTERIVLAGMSTEGCVAQTAIAAREHGFKVTVVPSASATADPELEEIALAYLVRVAGARLEPPAWAASPAAFGGLGPG